jgi:hypothetical protein
MLAIYIAGRQCWMGESLNDTKKRRNIHKKIVSRKKLEELWERKK